MLLIATARQNSHFLWVLQAYLHLAAATGKEISCWAQSCGAITDGIPVSITHYVQIVSNMPTAVAWSYKSSLRYLSRSFKELANPSVLPLSYLNARLPEHAVAAASLALETEELTQCLFPWSFLKGIRKKRCGLSLLGLGGYAFSFQRFAPTFWKL